MFHSVSAPQAHRHHFTRSPDSWRSEWELLVCGERAYIEHLATEMATEAYSLPFFLYVIPPFNAFLLR